MDKTITVKAPDSCYECIFNYDTIECRIFPKEYNRDYLETFDALNERPKWCTWGAVDLILRGQDVESKGKIR